MPHSNAQALEAKRYKTRATDPALPDYGPDGTVLAWNARTTYLLDLTVTLLSRRPRSTRSRPTSGEMGEFRHRVIIDLLDAIRVAGDEGCRAV